MFPDIVVKYVDLPRELPNKWDLANKVDTDGINVFEMALEGREKFAVLFCFRV